MPEPDANKPRIALLGVPIEIGASQAGTLMGPAALRTAGIGRCSNSSDFAVEDHGDMRDAGMIVADGPPPANAKYYDEVKSWIRALSERAFLLARSGAMPIFMGGDHSLSMGSVNGVARYWQEKGRPLFVLWLDAHADYNTPADDASPATCTACRRRSCAASPASTSARQRAARLDHARPARSVRHPLDRSAGEEAGARAPRRDRRHARDRRIRRRRADPQVIERVRAQNGVLHLSFDVDFLDPAVAPGVGTTVPGGATYREAHLIMELLHDSGLVRSVDIVELNPFLDERGRTARVAVELIGSLFGLQITDRRTPSNAVLPDNG